jgi:hypothetical protein
MRAWLAAFMPLKTLEHLVREQAHARVRDKGLDLG